MSLKNYCKDTVYGNQLTSVIRIILALLMLFSGFFKIIDIDAFSKVVEQYNIIPQNFVPYAALFVPLLEFVIGLLLLAGYKIKAASLLGMGLMLMFSVFIAINVWRGEAFECGCFELHRLGIGIDESVSIKLVVRDLIIAFLFGIIYIAKRHVMSFESIIERKNLENI